MRFGPAGFSHPASPYIALSVLAFIGYGVHVYGMVLFDDDLVGRFRGISNPSAIEAATNNFVQWSMGRPLGHASNVTFQTIFSEFPEWSILAFASIVLTLQSFVVYLIGREAKLGRAASFFGAAVYLTTPAAISLHLPVHSLATEWSTWFILAASLLALRKHFFLSGAIAALQVNVYEIYMTVFFIPYFIAIIPPIVAWRFDLLDLAKKFGLYVTGFFSVFIVFMFIRVLKNAAGRASMLDGATPVELVGRMVSAGWIGTGTLADMHLGAFDWAMSYGPAYIFGFSIMLFFVALLMRPQFGDEAAEGHAVASSVHGFYGAGVLIVAGLITIFMSYMVFFAQRYPPDWQTSRLANIHTAARFGLFFLAAGLTWLTGFFVAKLRQRKSHIAVTAARIRLVLAAAVITVFTTYNHAYGYQQVQQSQRVLALVSALHSGCEASAPGDVIIVITPPGFESSRTDRVLTWGNVYLGETKFTGWDNRVLIVRSHNRAPLLAALASSDGQISGSELVSLVDPAFSQYAWLFPRGDVARWGVIEEERIVIVDLQVERELYTVEILQAPSESRVCHRRPS
ncbi:MULTISPECIES: hypothetical protein [Hyphobacterium]|uniref:Glycosyltransferase RgtA/B/C/D-like domain-containing protein n=1 Tax=Hyphobacterium vulgare TaxID=1736751 RepID=A0ABV6ZVR0_9PROT